MKKSLLICIMVVLAVIVVNPVYPKGKKPPEMVDKSMEARLATILNVDKSMVVNLKNMDYSEEEIIRTLFIHITTETPIFQITKQYKQGTRWDDICEKYGVDIDIMNKETLNMLIYIGKVKKAEPVENQMINDILLPDKE